MAREVTKEEAEEILAKDRHRELTVALKNIATHLSNKEDSGIVEAIKEQVGKMDNLVSVIQSHNPEVNVELNPKEFVSSMQQMCKDIVESNNKVIETLENRMLPESFKLVKGYGGITESVKVNYKTAKEIHNNKK